MGLIPKRLWKLVIIYTYRFLTFKNYNFIEIPTYPAAFIPDNVIMSIIPRRCRICSALFSSHYTAIKGSHNSEVIDCYSLLQTRVLSYPSAFTPPPPKPEKLLISQGQQPLHLGLPAVFVTTRCSVLKPFPLVLHQSQCLCTPI